jgi:hypothetical protein
VAAARDAATASAAFDLAWEEGRALTLARAIEIALEDPFKRE